MYFPIICSIIGSFSVMVVSIVRWKHLSKQVGWVQLCNWFCNSLLFHNMLSYTDKCLKLIYRPIIGHWNTSYHWCIKMFFLLCLAATFLWCNNNDNTDHSNRPVCWALCMYVYVALLACVFCSQVHLLVQLALADLLAALVLLYSSAINKVSTDRRISICQYSLPLSVVSTVPCKFPLTDSVSCGIRQYRFLFRCSFEDASQETCSFDICRQ